MKKTSLLFGLSVLAVLFPASRIDAQIESALLSKISFNLTNPGGKSLAMGGAFTAIADDATAGLANPAGLGLISTIEAGVSMKRFDDVIGLVTARSTATGGLIAPYPTVRGGNSDLGGTTSALDYASVVLPVSRRFVAALTYAENLRFRGDPGEDGYSYIELRDNRSGGLTRRDFLYEYRELGAVSLANRVVGLSLAYRVTDRVRVGAGLLLNDTSFSLDGDAGGPHRIVSRTFLTPTQVETREVRMRVEDFGGRSAGFVVGAHADVLANGLLTVGATFRASGSARGTLVIEGDVPAALATRTRRAFSFSVPADAAVGVAVQPFPGLTIAAEGQWVSYSGSFDEPLDVISYRGLAGPSPGVPVDGILAEISQPPDVVVPRLGIEYVTSAESLRLALRIGYHREPAHGVKENLVIRDSAGTAFDLNDPPFSASVRTVFDGGRPDDRFSAGIGLTLNRFVSLDVAFEVGRASRELAASLFLRF
jgi:long-subunit fatty acid transport protein